MSTTDWYQLTVYIGKLLNTQVMNERDYIKVIRVFFQLQVLLTKLAVGACYSILEKIAEKGSIQDPKAEQVAQPRTPVIKASKMDGDASKGLSDLEEKKNSLMMVPFDTVKVSHILENMNKMNEINQFPQVVAKQWMTLFSRPLHWLGCR